MVQKLCWGACKLADTGPNQVSFIHNTSAFTQIKYHLSSPCQLRRKTQADTNTLSFALANSTERWFYVTDESGSNLHCMIQQSAYPSVMISGFQGKVWQTGFLSQLKVAFKINEQQNKLENAKWNDTQK